MIITTEISAFKYITSKKTGQEWLRVWVKVPDAEATGQPVESVVVPRPANAVSVGDKCMASVDGFGRLRDVSI